jgi:hypothetical protein
MINIGYAKQGEKCRNCSFFSRRLRRLQQIKKTCFPWPCVCEAAVAHCSVNCLPPPPLPPHILLIGGHQNVQQFEPFIFLFLSLSHTLLVHFENPLLPSHTHLASAVLLPQHLIVNCAHLLIFPSPVPPPPPPPATCLPSPPYSPTVLIRMLFFSYRCAICLICHAGKKFKHCSTSFC